MAILQSTTISGTGYLQIPVGITSERPTEPTWTVVSYTTGSGNFTVPANVYAVDVLVVAGGGGGGAWVGGGGGAGGVIYREGYQVTPGSTVAYSVGAGGTGEYNPGSYTGMPRATNGGNSTFGSITAIGGGYGGSWSPYPAQSGGSGGGNGYSYAGAAGTAGQGFRGGQGRGDSPNGYPTGGGGGAGGPGGDWRQPGSGELTTGAWGQQGKSGDGGPGVPCTITGSVVWYGGGGGGGIHGNSTASNAARGFGGIGGGGDGDGPNVDAGSANPNNTSIRLSGSTYPTGQSGVANTGGGGGGSGSGGGQQSAGGAGGSGVVIVRYRTGYNADLRPGAIRYNLQKGLEVYSNDNKWQPMTMPFLSRQIIARGYMAGGYKDSSAWNNVNRIYQATDVCTNLGDNSISRSFNYQWGACSDKIGYVFGAGNGHAVSSNVPTAFRFGTEVAYATTLGNMANNRFRFGGCFQETYFAWQCGGGATAVEETNLTTEVQSATTYTGFTSGESWGMSHETHGIMYVGGDYRIWHYATRTQLAAFGGDPSNSHQQKSVQSKMTYCWAGNEGSYNGGYNLRRSNMYTRTTSGTVAKPVTNNGEENFTMGQDWQYMLGEYNGAQNNNAWKFYYATESGFTGPSNMQPQGKGGSSSGVCWWST